MLESLALEADDTHNTHIKPANTGELVASKDMQFYKNTHTGQRITQSNI